MPRIGNKTNTISLRCDDDFIELLDKLIDKYYEHIFYDNISYSKLIRKAVEYLSKIDLDDPDVFMDIFGRCSPNTFKSDD